MSTEVTTETPHPQQHDVGGSSPKQELPTTPNTNTNTNTINNNNNNEVGTRKTRPARACTTRSAPRYDPTDSFVKKKKHGNAKKEKLEHQDQDQEEQVQQNKQCTKVITPLVSPPALEALLPRWKLRGMWELAAVLNFLNVFRPLLNITVEFTAEELETALLMANTTLDDIHIPLLKAIPPVNRSALGRNTWVTGLCRKLRDWWYWVAEGELPILASHGMEVEAYKALDPGTRVVILRALCEIRAQQEDIRNYIDGSLKHGVQLSVFRKERIGGDSHGISYWYEDDPIIGSRLYREIRKVEVKKVKTKGVLSFPTVSCQWETVATNLEEFEDVSEKLFSSKSRIETAVGKKLKNDILPEIEKIHKKKEKLVKKQHREALLLDSFLSADGIASGRSLRDRKPVTYTFDDFDRSITEAIKTTKRKQPSPEPAVGREVGTKPEASSNGKLNGRLHAPRYVSHDELSPKSSDSEETEEENKSGPLDRSNRRRQRPQRYSEKEFVEVISDNEAGFDSDDDIVGEVVYDEGYLRSRKQRKVGSSSEGEEKSWEENGDNEEEEEEDEEEEEEEYMSSSEESGEPQKLKKIPSRSNRKETKLRSVHELQSGLRRSRRATQNRINYRHIEFSESEAESPKQEKLNGSGERSDASNDSEYSTDTPDSQENGDEQKVIVDQPVQEFSGTVKKEHRPSPRKTNIPGQEAEGVGRRQFLDLNELAPGPGFDDGSN